MLAEIWAPNLSQNTSNKLFIDHCQGRFVRVWNCLIFFVGEYLSVSPEICHVLSQIQWRFLRGILRKNYLGRVFQKFYANQGILYRNLWNFALLSEIFFWVRNALKKFTQVLSYVVCTPVRRHIHKRITIRRYEKEKPWRFVFGKLVCSLSVWDLLRLTPWVFWSEIFTRRSSLCLFSFGSYLSTRFVPQDLQ